MSLRIRGLNMTGFKRQTTFQAILLLTAVFCACGDGVPDDTLLPAGIQTDHLETFRPQLHYTPESGWMNDPNGLVRVGETWNLYHQYIPGEYVIDRMNWGHATSKDLLHWEYQPVALQTDPVLGMAYSGSAIVDEGNISGLCGDDTAQCVLAFFTHSLMLGGDQKQSVAVSNDGGLTFAGYESNPIMPNPGMANFRDPKVFLYDGSLADAPATTAPAKRIPPEGPLPTSWIMALAQGRQIGLYTSGNLLEWQPLSTLDNDNTWAGGVWECPDLIRMEVENEPGAFRWLLITGVFSGAPWEGSGVQYMIGSFDGYTFTPDGDLVEPRWLDHGWDFYAAQSFSNVPTSDGRHVMMAWMNNWKYALGIPAMPWQGAMAFPRQLSLTKEGDGAYTILQAPVDELSSLRRGKVVDLRDIELQRLTYMATGEPSDYLYEFIYSSDTGLYEIDLTGPRDGNWNIQIASAGPLATQEAATITTEHRSASTSREAAVAPAHNAVVMVGIRDGSLFIDRGNALCDTCPSNMGMHYSTELAKTADLATAGLATDTVTMKIIVDHSSIEVFADGGRTTMTALAFLPGPKWDISMEAWDETTSGDVTIDSLEIHELMSIWARPD